MSPIIRNASDQPAPAWRFVAILLAAVAVLVDVSADIFVVPDHLPGDRVQVAVNAPVAPAATLASPEAAVPLASAVFGAHESSPQEPAPTF